VRIAPVGVSGWLFVSGAIAEKKALRQETMSIATSAEEPAKNPSAEQKPAPTAAAEEETAPAAAMTDESVREAAKNVRVWPVSGSTQAAYSVVALQYNATTQDWRTHAGVDLAASVGTPVKAAGSGVVTAVYDDEFLGTTVVINHPDGHVSQYSNVGRHAVRLGGRQRRGRADHRRRRRNGSARNCGRTASALCRLCQRRHHRPGRIHPINADKRRSSRCGVFLCNRFCFSATI